LLLKITFIEKQKRNEKYKYKQLVVDRGFLGHSIPGIQSINIIELFIDCDSLGESKLVHFESLGDIDV